MGTIGLAGWMAVGLIAVGLVSLVVFLYMLARHPDLMERDSYDPPWKDKPH